MKHGHLRPYHRRCSRAARDSANADGTRYGWSWTRAPAGAAWRSRSAAAPL